VSIRSPLYASCQDTLQSTTSVQHDEHVSLRPLLQALNSGIPHLSDATVELLSQAHRTATWHPTVYSLFPDASHGDTDMILHLDQSEVFMGCMWYLLRYRNTLWWPRSEMSCTDDGHRQYTPVSALEHVSAAISRDGVSKPDLSLVDLELLSLLLAELVLGQKINPRRLDAPTPISMDRLHHAQDIVQWLTRPPKSPTFAMSKGYWKPHMSILQRQHGASQHDLSTQFPDADAEAPQQNTHSCSGASHHSPTSIFAEALQFGECSSSSPGTETETSDTTDESLDDVDAETDIDLETQKKHIVDSLMADVYEMSSSANLRMCSPRASSASSSQRTSGPSLDKSSNVTSKRRALAERDRNDEQSDKEDEGTGKRRKTLETSVEEAQSIRKKFACPFFKREPWRHRASKACAGPGWDTIARIK
jgi:hypothetical protein